MAEKAACNNKCQHSSDISIPYDGDRGVSEWLLRGYFKRKHFEFDCGSSSDGYDIAADMSGCYCAAQEGASDKKVHRLMTLYRKLKVEHARTLIKQNDAL